MNILSAYIKPGDIVFPTDHAFGDKSLLWIYDTEGKDVDLANFNPKKYWGLYYDSITKHTPLLVLKIEFLERCSIGLWDKRKPVLIDVLHEDKVKNMKVLLHQGQALRAYFKVHRSPVNTFLLDQNEMPW